MGLLSVLAGPVLGLAGSIFSAKKASSEASMNRSFQERMATHRHQYEVEDLRKAGLNPILSANSGMSIPSGATAQVPDYGSALTKGLASAVAFKEFKLKEKKVNAEVDLLRAEAEAQRASALELSSRVDTMYPAQVASYSASAMESRQRVQNLQLELNLINQQISESVSRQHNIQAQIRNIKAQIRESNSRVAVNRAQKRLNELNSLLFKEKIDTQKAITKKSEAEAEIAGFNVKVERTLTSQKYKYLNKTGTKFFNENVPGWFKSTYK